MAFAGAGRAEEERVFPLLTEAGRRELVDQHTIHLLVEIELKAVERAVGVLKAGELVRRAKRRSSRPTARTLSERWPASISAPSCCLDLPTAAAGVRAIALSPRRQKA
jgi:hypothetical protein